MAQEKQDKSERLTGILTKTDRLCDEVTDLKRANKRQQLMDIDK